VIGEQPRARLDSPVAVVRTRIFVCKYYTVVVFRMRTAGLWAANVMSFCELERRKRQGRRTGEKATGPWLKNISETNKTIQTSEGVRVADAYAWYEEKAQGLGDEFCAHFMPGRMRFCEIHCFLPGSTKTSGGVCFGGSPMPFTSEL
jgi:hypothetical protein